MKSFRILLAVLLLFSTVLCLASCGGNGDAKDTTKANDTTVADTTVADTTEAANITFTAKVTDEEGNPLEGVYVQLCLESCVFVATDKDGNANFNAEQIPAITEGYKLSILTCPEGYTSEYTNDAPLYVEAGATECTVVLKKAG